MTNEEIYYSLIQKKGSAYRKSQILSAEQTHYLDPMDHSPERHAGNSHIAGDASPEVQSRVIDALIAASQRAGLDAHQTAYVIAIARHESGFNPDAAAGTTTAYGLGQFITKTGEKYGINNDNRGDLTKQAEALVAHYKDNADIAAKRGLGEEYIYKYHHDGPVGEYGGLEISKQHVIPYVARYEEFVRDYEKTHAIVPVDPTFYARNRADIGGSNHAHARAEEVLRQGAHGEAVKTLQSDLAALGYTDNRGRVLRIDGHYGPSTEAAVRAFQGEYGLNVDGIAGKHTLQAIHGQRSLLGVVPAFAPELEGRYPAPVEALDTVRHMQVPTRNPFADPSHPEHGLYAELKERIPDASENRLTQLTAACHMAGIKPGHLQDIHISKQGILMTSDNLSVPPTVVNIASPAPPVEQSVQQMQAYDHQCAISAQMRTQELAQAQIQHGPAMGGPHR